MTRRGWIGGLGAHALLIALAIPYLLPLVWMVATSLKGETQIFPREGGDLSPLAPANLVPSPPQWHTYADVFSAVPFATYLANSVLLCVVSVLATVLSSAIVAYGFARLRFPGREPLFALMLMTMAMPAQVTMVPTFALFRWLGWYDTLLPLIVPAFFASPFFVFLMRQFFRGLPEEIFEAARVEGAGEWTLFTRIALPLSKPVLATCAVFQCMGTWNDFFGPLLYVNDPSRYTLAYGLQQFISAYGGDWALLMAASTIFVAPMVVLFFLAQRSFVQGIATTGGK
jgi:multiple sugar transport system permease protein